MTRDDVYAVVKKYLVRTVDGLQEERIQPTKSMKELGANSLDIVEVVSLSMRELKVKVPRSELVKLTDIEGLVELLYSVKEQQAQTA